MRRTLLCGLLLTAAGVAAWSVTMASALVAADAPAPETASGKQEEVVENTVASNGVSARRLPVTRGGRQEVVEQIDEEFTRLGRREAELAQQSQSLLRKFAETEGNADRAPIVDDLEETIGKQFDIQQQMRELEVSRIEAKVKQLRETLTKRAGARAAIIGNRREQLVREAEGLGWNSPDGGPHGAIYQTTPLRLPQPLPQLRAAPPAATPATKPAERR